MKHCGSNLAEFSEIKKAKKDLFDSDYDQCSRRCGIIIESLLINNLKRFMAADSDINRIVQEYLRSNRIPMEYLTLGTLHNLYEKTNILFKVSSKYKLNLKEINLISLKTIVSIRNRVAHPRKEVDNNKAESDAYIMYGNALKLLECCGLTQMPERIDRQPREKELSKHPPTFQSKDTKREEISPPFPTPIQTIPKQVQQSIEIAKNKTSGLYFIYIEAIGENDARFVTPSAVIMTLQIKHFDEVETKEEGYVLSHNLINEEQLKQYKEHIADSQPREKRKITHKFRPQKSNRPYIDRKAREKSGLYTLPPEGTSCRFFYKNKAYNGNIMNGMLNVTGYGSFSSFSGASVKITNTSRNGWKDWEIKTPGSPGWILADSWRR